MANNDVQEFRDFFIYNFSFSALADAASVSVNVNILADSDFFWVEGIGHFFTATSTWAAYPRVTVRVFDSGSGRQLDNEAMVVRSYFGLPDEPVQIRPNKRFVANSSVQLTFTNNHGSTIALGHCSMLGFKSYRVSP